MDAERLQLMLTGRGERDVAVGCDAEETAVRRVDTVDGGAVQQDFPDVGFVAGKEVDVVLPLAGSRAIAIIPAWARKPQQRPPRRS